MDFTAKNPELDSQTLENTEAFCNYIDHKLNEGGFLYGIGGYNELRTVYNRSPVFDAAVPGEEPRRLHLGTDIWGKAGTPVFAFMGGMVHSYAFNHQFGDYGATLITLHQLDGVSFYTLYGHLSLRDIENISSGQYITRGEIIGHFGEPHENGHWPPHLHVQIIIDLELREGDYPGVCRYSERDKYLSNCPDPDLILNMNRFL
jgi:murein DD-endopeptidase MepM/ murein hydrolase activator NlpD